MYTYESFETLGTFTLLRPVFVTLLVATLAIFVLVLLPPSKQKFVNGFSITILSVVLLFVSAQLLWYSGIIVDEIGLGGDSFSTAIFLIIAFLCLVNPFIYLVRKA